MYIAGGELFASHGTWQMEEFADTAPRTLSAHTRQRR